MMMINIHTGRRPSKKKGLKNPETKKSKKKNGRNNYEPGRKKNSLF